MCCQYIPIRWLSRVCICLLITILRICMSGRIVYLEFSFWCVCMLSIQLVCVYIRTHIIKYTISRTECMKIQTCHILLDHKARNTECAACEWTARCARRSSDAPDAHASPVASLRPSGRILPHYLGRKIWGQNTLMHTHARPINRQTNSRKYTYARTHTHTRTHTSIHTRSTTHKCERGGRAPTHTVFSQLKNPKYETIFGWRH